ncbi:MAG: hypothetical protein IPK10_11030 [Bacteroidetes bacterium]|nr:hypothetical protein [Bacteroidota bacterium]
MTNPNAENKEIDWEEVILRLQTLTRSLAKGKGWFRGVETTVYLKGKEIDDYVFEAIEIHLRNPEKFEPNKGSFIKYLFYSIIRNLVRYDLVSAENRTTNDVFAYQNDNEDEDNSAPYLDAILPYAEVFFDQEIDFKEVMSYIESEAKGDAIVENIFLGLSGYGLKRAEIIKEFNMTPVEYDNGMRRLITIRNKAAKKYDINSHYEQQLKIQ